MTSAVDPVAVPTGPDTTTELESFRRNVVDPLVLIDEVRPLRAGKTEMGSDCGA